MEGGRNSDVIQSLNWKSAIILCIYIEHDGVVDSVPSMRYSSVCNVLHVWKISLIPTYRDRLYDNYKKRKKIFYEQRSRDAVAQKIANISGVGKIIIIMRISIYLLTTTPTNHTSTL